MVLLLWITGPVLPGPLSSFRTAMADRQSAEERAMPGADLPEGRSVQLSAAGLALRRPPYATRRRKQCARAAGLCARDHIQHDAIYPRTCAASRVRRPRIDALGSAGDGVVAQYELAVASLRILGRNRLLIHFHCGGPAKRVQDLAERIERQGVHDFHMFNHSEHRMVVNVRAFKFYNFHEI